MTDTKPYPTLALPDLLNGPTEIDWLIEPFIPPGASVLLAGDSGVGKTWLSLDLSLAIATGGKWLGHFPTRQGPVLIVDEENSDLLLRVRLHKMLRARGIGGDLPLHFLVGKMIDLSPLRRKTGTLVTTPSYNRLLATVTALRPVLVVFDSLTRCHRSNENLSSEMATVFANVKRLMNETGASTLLVHHFNKGKMSKNRSGDKIRGSSDIRAFADCTLLVGERDGGCRVIHDKSRWSESTAPFAVDFCHGDDNSFRIAHAGEADPSGGYVDVLRQVWDYVLDTLTVGGSKTRQELIQGRNGLCSVRTLDKVLGWRVEKNFLEKRKDGKRVLFSLGVSALEGTGPVFPNA